MSNRCHADYLDLQDVPAFHVVVGNPAKIIRKIEPKEPDPALASEQSETITEGVASRT